MKGNRVKRVVRARDYTRLVSFIKTKTSQRSSPIHAEAPPITRLCCHAETQSVH